MSRESGTRRRSHQDDTSSAEARERKRYKTRRLFHEYESMARPSDDHDVVQAMEDEGIDTWRDWCKYKHRTTTVSTEKLVAYIDAFVLPRETILTRQRLANQVGSPVSGIEAYIRPVLNLWSRQLERQDRPRPRMDPPRRVHTTSPTSTTPFCTDHGNGSWESREEGPQRSLRRSIASENHSLPHQDLLLSAMDISKDAETSQEQGKWTAPSNIAFHAPVHSSTTTTTTTTKTTATRSKEITADERRPFINIFTALGKAPRARQGRITSPSGSIPQYSIIRTRQSIQDLYREWSEGLNGQPSIVELNEKYGTLWRPLVDRNHFSASSVIVNEIGRLQLNKDISLEEAMDQLEKWRLRTNVGLIEFARLISVETSQRKTDTGSFTPSTTLQSSAGEDFPASDIPPYQYLYIFTSEGRLPYTPKRSTADFESPPPYYRLDQHSDVVHDLYKEWSEGVGGGPSIMSLNETYGTLWRHAKDNARFKSMSQVLGEVGRLVHTTGVSIECALDIVERKRESFGLSRLGHTIGHEVTERKVGRAAG